VAQKRLEEAPTTNADLNDMGMTMSPRMQESHKTGARAADRVEPFFRCVRWWRSRSSAKIRAVCVAPQSPLIHRAENY